MWRKCKSYFLLLAPGRSYLKKPDIECSVVSSWRESFCILSCISLVIFDWFWKKLLTKPKPSNLQTIGYPNCISLTHHVQKLYNFKWNISIVHHEALEIISQINGGHDSVDRFSHLILIDLQSTSIP